MRFSPSTKTRILLFGKLLLMLVFAVSYGQSPLYSSNQNTYFLHGLADDDGGFLKSDWLAQTTDTTPLFSSLVGATIRFLGENSFYLYYIVILGIYVYSIMGIASYAFRIDSAPIKYLSYFVLLTMLYSGLLLRLLWKLPVLWRLASFASPILDPNGLLTWGVAGQYILGPIFQPSTFGVFIVLSVYVFLRDKPFVAVLCLAIAATFHSSYLLSAAVLTLAYMLILFMKGRNFQKVFFVGMFALLLVIPVLAYDYVHFSPTNADIASQGQTILVDYRIPHHARPANWFGNSTLFQIAVVILALYLVRRTRLFPVLLFPFLAAIILTIAQVITGNKSLALLFPWRISIFLVPIASSIILASIVSFAFQIFGKPITKSMRVLLVAVSVVMIVIGYWGIRNTLTLLNAPRVGVNPSVSFVASTFQPGNLYLIPPDIETFRLAARVPIFVDFKSHPYKDTEVVEWFNRNSTANDFYAANAGTDCNILGNISARYGVTHVVLKNNSPAVNCQILHELYKDKDFGVYKVSDR